MEDKKEGDVDVEIEAEIVIGAEIEAEIEREEKRLSESWRKKRNADEAVHE